MYTCFGDCFIRVFILGFCIITYSGPDNHTKFIKVSDDDADDGQNAMIVCKLSPDCYYYLQIQKFEFSVTSW